METTKLLSLSPLLQLLFGPFHQCDSEQTGLLVRDAKVRAVSVRRAEMGRVSGSFVRQHAKYSNTVQKYRPGHHFANLLSLSFLAPSRKKQKPLGSPIPGWGPCLRRGMSDAGARHGSSVVFPPSHFHRNRVHVFRRENKPCMRRTRTV
ncbi:hypothetical protein BDP81DRAFT_31528 [Colletotrichum phormii]|uniref:Secreted protein n=1 Tax=Colletotrichum phormii TaxID=359342 RepID=A0AAI9ZQE5_9PEZI|nr:uncharacterized protein BDP81DRAFT_31528 [Colletotrichum phormii]KAK1635940.1 hypothetical protein BDP81DRAFT_31528 [Colletotrichum phormii]